MSNYPDGSNFAGTAYDYQPEQSKAQVKAEEALEWIQSLQQQIQLLLINGAVTHKLNVTKEQASEAIEYIQEALDDLFAKDKERLTDIVEGR